MRAGQGTVELAAGRRRGRCGGLAVLLAAAVLLAGAGAPLHGHSLRGLLAGRVQAALAVASATGVHVVELESGETVYEFEADRQRIVASNTKLVVTAAALDRLGPGYFFETYLLASGVLEGDELAGDLAVVGGGDPNISGRHHEGDSLAVFRRWAAELRRRGVRRVDGDLYLDYGRFGPPRVHPDWPRDQLSRWYEAPVEALSFNDNCVLVRVWPGARPGLPARVEITPDLPLFQVENRARTTSSARRHRVTIERREGTNVLEVSGSAYLRAASVDSWVTVADPVEYFGAALLAAFRDEGVEVLGSARPVRSLPRASWRRVTVERSDLMTTAEIINKRSQNFYAESLLKTLAANECGAGTWPAGREVVVEFLDGIGIEEGSYRLADGSGMSRNNRFTPRQLTRLLSHMYSHPRGAEYLLTLPYSGETGLKWEDRLAEPPYGGNVFAKTGSLRSVSTLSGYAKARSGKTYAFSILMNSSRNAWQAKRAQDGIVKALIDNG